METSKDFTRAIRARYDVKSDYAFAKLIGITRSTMSLHKTGGVKAFSEDTGYRIAELLDLDAGYVLSCLAAERSKDIKVKKVWQRLAELTRVAIIAPVLFAVTLAGSALVTPSPAFAYQLCILCQVVRRWLHRLARTGVAVALLSLFSIPATADEGWTMRDTMLFAAGAAIPIVAHEAGHAVAGGRDIEWSGTDWRCTSACNGSRIAGAGFIAEITISEAVARAFDAPDQRAFRLGVRSSAALHLLVYAARDNSDLENFSPRDRRRARLLIAAAGVFNLIQLKREF